MEGQRAPFKRPRKCDLTRVYMSGRFVAAECGPEWQGRENLARVMESMNFTRAQALVIRLQAEGKTFGEIKDAVGWRREHVHNALRKAWKKLELWQRQADRERCVTLADVLRLMQNRAEDGGPVAAPKGIAPPPMPRAAPYGTRVEDFFPGRESVAER